MINLTLWYFLKTYNYLKNDDFWKPCVTQVIMEYEMVEYEYLVLDIFFTWRIYFKNFKK